MSKLTPYLAALLAALALGVAACGDDEEEPSGSGEATATAEATQASGIVNNPDNAKVSLKIGSKNFTEQKVLGEIYAQGLAAAGYNTTTDLNLAPILMQNIRVQGVIVGSRETFEALNRAVVQHRLRPVVDRVFPFAEARAALEWMAGRKHFGKIVIRIG